MMREMRASEKRILAHVDEKFEDMKTLVNNALTIGKKSVISEKKRRQSIAPYGYALRIP